MLKRIRSFLSNPVHLALTNTVLIIVIVLANIYMQAFCIPTTWAIIFLSFCFLHTILYPVLLRYSSLHVLSGFISGISFCVFVYCIVFLEHINLLGLLATLIVIGIITYIPHFFAFQLIWIHIINPISRTARNSFAAGILVCIIVAMFVGKMYSDAIAEVERCQDSNFQILERTFMTEKILGMHFIYHTRICEYDGWRPPKHEPLLILGMWLNHRRDPMHVDLDDRIELYKKFFPENKIKFNCSCAVEYSNSYHGDEIWKRHGLQ